MSQQTQLTTARGNASTYAQGAVSYLNTGTSGLRYTTWFGLYDPSRYSRVKSNFGKISDAFRDATITFDCSSKRNVYAFVYPNQPFKIYLGRVYWSAPATGTDSQAGTLIHLKPPGALASATTRVRSIPSAATRSASVWASFHA